MKTKSTLLLPLATLFLLGPTLDLLAQRQQQQRRQQPIPSDEAVQSRVPDGVTFVPNIPYREGNERWKLDLAMPSEKADSPRPAIVFIHGGGWRNGDKRKSNFLNPALDYAAKGYVTITVNYRLTGTDPFPACIEDVKNAVRWLRAHADEYNVDPDRIGAHGNSAGAHLVSMLGLAKKDADLEGDGPYQDQSSLVQAVCPSATPTDFLNWKNGQPIVGGFLGIEDDEFEKRARNYSPITHAGVDAPPFLLVHGTKDNTVPVSQSDRFEKALKEAGAKDVTYLRFDGAGHGVFSQHKDETAPAMEEFFARTLKLNQ
ncbi:MAG: alpha/beta hydrolase [Verrucomicrobiota bacterium]